LAHHAYIGLKVADVTGDLYGASQSSAGFHRNPLRQIASDLIRLGGPISKATSRDDELILAIGTMLGNYMFM
jgi:hypothetical protein